MNKLSVSNAHIHVFLFSLIVAVTPYFILLISLAVWMVPVFIIICLIDYINGTVIRKKTGLALASMFLASIIGLGIMYLTNLTYQNP
jgi:cytochrome c oxidase assembly protein Cox11